MQKISSFTVNHDILEKGVYISRIDGDVMTYDIRMKKSNGGDYLSDNELHTIEHLFATYVRNSIYQNSIIYVGPMGCRTGFYLLTRDTISNQQALDLIKESFSFISTYNSEIPGSHRSECGNYLEHDLRGARTVASDMKEVLSNWTTEKMIYNK